MRNQNFALPLAIHSACAFAQTAIGLANSVDVRGWWPIGLAVTLLLYAIYSLAFASIAGDCVLSTAYIVGLNGVLAALQVLANYLFYALPINWGAVNAHIVQLTLFERVVRSDWTFWLMPVPFLIAHFVAIRAGRLGLSSTK